jgi:hypothetical protein
MELDIKELDNIHTMNPYDTLDHKEYEEDNSVNYWKQPIKQENKERKKVSFNDILTNMNLVVNKEGVLQFMAPNKQDIQQPSVQQNYNPNDFSQQPNHFLPQQTYNQSNQAPLDHSVKHSYIYNKYFKDYVDPNTHNPGPRVPKTIEEYRQMILEDRIKAIQHKKRIEQIKSTKLMFTSATGSVSDPKNMKATKNTLRTMNFR